MLQKFMKKRQNLRRKENKWMMTMMRISQELKSLKKKRREVYDDDEEEDEDCDRPVKAPVMARGLVIWT